MIIQPASEFVPFFARQPFRPRDFDQPLQDALLLIRGLGIIRQAEQAGDILRGQT